MAAKKSSVEIISTKIIKPSSPTPNHKRFLKLSLLDQTFSRYGSTIYCYKTPPNISLTSSSLQKSLSKALELFYPFAGRFNDNFTSIDCNDHGAYFLEAIISSKLSEFLRNPNPETVTELLPCSGAITLSEATRNNVVTLVQLTVFSCGGIAVGLQVSHKIADAFSVSRFAKTWAAISAGNRDVTPPVFAGSSLHSPQVHPIKRIAPTPLQAPLRSRRFLFSVAKLAALKRKIQQNGGVDFRPSTVEAISSLLVRCVAPTTSGASALVQMVNLRQRLTPFLPVNCIGNLAWPLIVSSRGSERTAELHEIVTVIRKGLSEFFSDCRDDGLKGEVLLSMAPRVAEEEAELAKAGISLNWVSVLSSFRPYETDFGWGEPAWVTAPLFFNKRFIMMHSKSGKEIEVWATLEESAMAKFERNQELLAFTSDDVPMHMAIFAHSRL